MFAMRVAFHAWQQYAIDRQAHKQRTLQAYQLWARSAQQRCLRAWASAAWHQRWRKAQACKLRLLAERALKRRCLHAWREWQRSKVRCTCNLHALIHVS
jgi:hypothetical protein